MKRYLALLLCAAMILCAFGCAGKAGDPEPAPTAEAAQTQAASPTPYETAPAAEASPSPEQTRAPREVIFTNSLSRPVSLTIRQVWPWSPADTYEAAPGEMLYFAFDQLSQSPEKQDSFVITAADNEGRSCRVWDVPLALYDSITLAETARGCSFTVAHYDDTADRYTAFEYTDSAPSGEADENLLGVCVDTASSAEAAHRFFPDGLDYADLLYQTVELSPESAEAYPKLAEAVHENSRFVYGEYMFLYHSLCESVIHTEGFTGRGDFRAEAFVRRADSGVFSVLYRIAYTMEETSVFWNCGNFDSRTGKPIELSDAVRDIEAFTEAVNSLLAEKGSEVTIGRGDWSDKEDVGRPAWVIDRNGIYVFVFDRGMGENVYISFDDEKYGELLNAGLKAQTESFVSAFPLDTQMYFDNEGEAAGFRVYPMEGEYGAYAAVEYNGTVYELKDIELAELIAEGIAPVYYSARAEGADLLLIPGVDIDGFLLHTVGAKDGRLCYLGSAYWEPTAEKLASVVAYQVEAVRTQLITDPARFKMTQRTELLGTVPGACLAGLSGAFLPEPIEYLFELEPVEFTMLCDIEAELVGADGAPSGSVTLKTGEKVKYFRTDGMSYADLITENGSVARVYVTICNGDDPDWAPPSIDGVVVSLIFEGVVFTD